MSDRPRIFVGSAIEHADLLQRLLRLNAHSKIRYVPWTNLGSFPPGGYVLDTLLETLKELDGAVFLTFGLDKTWWRERYDSTPRDNVVLEAGMAFSIFGRHGTAIVTDGSVTLPSDLQGLLTLSFSPSDDPDDDVSELHAHLESYFSGLSGSRRVLRKLWSESQYSLVFHTFDNPEPGEFEEIVNFNAVRAISGITDCLSRLGSQLRLESSRDEVSVRSNLILLGSSASNRATTSLVKQLDKRLRFVCEFDEISRGDRRIVDRTSGASHPAVHETGYLATDYGVVTKIRNPFDTSKWVIVAEGNYGLGTAAAVRLITDSDALNRAGIALGGEFQALVEVSAFARFGMGEPRVLAVETL